MLLFSFYVLQMEDSNLVTLELLKHLIFKAGFQRFSAFFPKQELENHGIFLGGRWRGEGRGIAYHVPRSFPVGSEVSNDYCSFSVSIILEM